MQEAQLEPERVPVQEPERVPVQEPEPEPELGSEPEQAWARGQVPGLEPSLPEQVPEPELVRVPKQVPGLEMEPELELLKNRCMRSRTLEIRRRLYRSGPYRRRWFLLYRDCPAGGRRSGSTSARRRPSTTRRICRLRSRQCTQLRGRLRLPALHIRRY